MLRFKIDFCSNDPTLGGQQRNPDLGTRAVGREAYVHSIPKDANYPSTLQLGTPQAHAQQHCIKTAFPEEIQGAAMAMTTSEVNAMLASHYGGAGQQPNPDIVPANETAEELSIRTFDQYARDAIATVATAHAGNNTYDVNGPAEEAALRLILRVVVDERRQNAEIGHQELLMKTMPSTGGPTTSARNQLKALLDSRTQLRRLKEALCTDIEALVAAGAAFTHAELLQQALAAEARGQGTRLLHAVDQGHLRRAAAIENAIRAEVRKQEQAEEPPLPTRADAVVQYALLRASIAEIQGRTSNTESRRLEAFTTLNLIVEAIKQAPPSSMLAKVGLPAIKLSATDPRSLNPICTQKIGGKDPALKTTEEIAERFHALLHEFKEDNKANLRDLDENAALLREAGCNVPATQESQFPNRVLIQRAAQFVAAGQRDKGLQLFNTGGIGAFRRSGGTDVASTSLSDKGNAAVTDIDDVLRLFQAKADEFSAGKVKDGWIALCNSMQRGEKTFLTQTAITKLVGDADTAEQCERIWIRHKKGLSGAPPQSVIDWLKTVNGDDGRRGRNGQPYGRNWKKSREGQNEGQSGLDRPAYWGGNASSKRKYGGGKDRRGQSNKRSAHGVAASGKPRNQTRQVEQSSIHDLDIAATDMDEGFEAAEEESFTPEHDDAATPQPPEPTIPMVSEVEGECNETQHDEHGGFEYVLRRLSEERNIGGGHDDDQHDAGIDPDYQVSAVNLTINITDNGTPKRESAPQPSTETHDGIRAERRNSAIGAGSRHHATVARKGPTPRCKQRRFDHGKPKARFSNHQPTIQRETNSRAERWRAIEDGDREARRNMPHAKKTHRRKGKARKERRLAEQALGWGVRPRTPPPAGGWVHDPRDAIYFRESMELAAIQFMEADAIPEPKSGDSIHDIVVIPATTEDITVDEIAPMIEISGNSSEETVSLDGLQCTNGESADGPREETTTAGTELAITPIELIEARHEEADKPQRESQLPESCACCGSTYGLKSCIECGTRYCGEGCQLMDWPRHAHSCYQATAERRYQHRRLQGAQGTTPMGEYIKAIFDKQQGWPSELRSFLFEDDAQWRRGVGQQGTLGRKKAAVHLAKSIASLLFLSRGICESLTDRWNSAFPALQRCMMRRAVHAVEHYRKSKMNSLSDQLSLARDEVVAVREEGEMAWSNVEWQMRAQADLQSTVDALEGKFRKHHARISIQRAVRTWIDTRRRSAAKIQQEVRQWLQWKIATPEVNTIWAMNSPTLIADRMEDETQGLMVDLHEHREITDIDLMKRIVVEPNCMMPWLQIFSHDSNEKVTRAVADSAADTGVLIKQSHLTLLSSHGMLEWTQATAPVELFTINRGQKKYVPTIVGRAGLRFRMATYDKCAPGNVPTNFQFPFRDFITVYVNAHVVKNMNGNAPPLIFGSRSLRNMGIMMRQDDMTGWELLLEKNTIPSHAYLDGIRLRNDWTFETNQRASVGRSEGRIQLVSSLATMEPVQRHRSGRIEDDDDGDEEADEDRRSRKRTRDSAAAEEHDDGDHYRATNTAGSSSASAPAEQDPGQDASHGTDSLLPVDDDDEDTRELPDPVGDAGAFLTMSIMEVNTTGEATTTDAGQPTTGETLPAPALTVDTDGDDDSAPPVTSYVDPGDPGTLFDQAYDIARNAGVSPIEIIHDPGDAQEPAVAASELTGNERIRKERDIDKMKVLFGPWDELRVFATWFSANGTRVGDACIDSGANTPVLVSSAIMDWLKKNGVLIAFRSYSKQERERSRIQTMSSGKAHQPEICGTAILLVTMYLCPNETAFGGKNDRVTDFSTPPRGAVPVQVYINALVLNKAGSPQIIAGCQWFGRQGVTPRVVVKGGKQTSAAILEYGTLISDTLPGPLLHHLTYGDDPKGYSIYDRPALEAALQVERTAGSLMALHRPTPPQRRPNSSLSAREMTEEKLDELGMGGASLDSKEDQSTDADRHGKRQRVSWHRDGDAGSGPRDANEIGCIELKDSDTPSIGESPVLRRTMTVTVDRGMFAGVFPGALDNTGPQAPVMADTQTALRRSPVSAAQMPHTSDSQHDNRTKAIEQAASRCDVKLRSMREFPKVDNLVSSRTIDQAGDALAWIKLCSAAMNVDSDEYRSTDEEKLGCLRAAVTLEVPAGTVPGGEHVHIPAFTEYLNTGGGKEKAVLVLNAEDAEVHPCVLIAEAMYDTPTEQGQIIPVRLWNHGQEPCIVKEGAKIALLTAAPAIAFDAHDPNLEQAQLLWESITSHDEEAMATPGDVMQMDQENPTIEKGIIGAMSAAQIIEGLSKGTFTAEQVLNVIVPLVTIGCDLGNLANAAIEATQQEPRKVVHFLALMEQSSDNGGEELHRLNSRAPTAVVKSTENPTEMREHVGRAVPPELRHAVWFHATEPLRTQGDDPDYDKVQRKLEAVEKLSVMTSPTAVWTIDTSPSMTSYVPRNRVFTKTLDLATTGGIGQRHRSMIISNVEFQFPKQNLKPASAAETLGDEARGCKWIFDARGKAHATTEPAPSVTALGLRIGNNIHSAKDVSIEGIAKLQGIENARWPVNIDKLRVAAESTPSILGSILARAFIESVNITNAAVAMINRHAAFPPDLPQLRNAADAAFNRPDILHTLNAVSLYKAHFDRREDQLLAAAVAAVQDGEPELPSDERTLYIHQTDDELEKQRYATEQLEKRFRPDYSDEDKHPSSVMDIFNMLTTNGLYERTDIPGGDKTIARMEKMVMATFRVFDDLFRVAGPQLMSLRTTRIVNERGYPQNNPEKFQAMKEIIEELVSKGVLVRNHSSPYRSPALVVPKKVGDRGVKKLSSRWRFVVDYRSLNAATISERYGPPQAECVVNNMAHCKFRSFIDNTKGYWQLALHPYDSTRDASCFFIPKIGSFSWTRVVMGLKGSASVYQTFIERLLGGALFSTAAAYIDDVVVFNKTLDSHLESLMYVFIRYVHCGATMNLEKSSFLVTGSHEFLGYDCDMDGIRPCARLMKSITQLQPPKTLKNLRALLGLMNYHRKFIPAYAEKSFRLVEATKRQKFKGLSTEELRDFTQLRDELVRFVEKGQKIYFVDWKEPIHIYTDASAHGLGVYAFQDVNGHRRPIAYLSRSVKDMEKKWDELHLGPEGKDTRQLELLSLLWALEELSNVIGITTGANVIAHTDHRNLLALVNTSRARSTTAGDARLARWAIRLSQFPDLTLKYQPGAKNECADSLSRLAGIEDEDGTARQHDTAIGAVMLVDEVGSADQPSYRARLTMVAAADDDQDAGIVSTDASILPATTGPAPTLQEVQDAQRSNPGLSQLKRELEALTDDSEAPKHLKDLLVNQKGLVCRRAGRYKQPTGQEVIPRTVPIIPRNDSTQALRTKIMSHCHAGLFAGHLGKHATLQRVKDRYYWPKMEDEIVRFVKSCLPCRLAKTPNTRRAGFLQSYEHYGPMHTVCIDIVEFSGAMSRATTGESKILVMVDTFTRFLITVPIHDKSIKTVGSAILRELFLKFGAPTRLISDQAFNTDDWRQLMALLNTECGFVSAYNSRSNPAERMIGHIQRLLRTYVSEFPKVKDDGVFLGHAFDYLPMVTMAHNTAPMDDTGLSPFEIMYGRKFLWPSDIQMVEDCGFLPERVSISEYYEHRVEQFSKASAWIHRLLEERKGKNAKQHDALQHFLLLQPGDLVIIDTPTRAGKLACQHIGPAEVIEQISNLIYRVKLIGKPKSMNVHVRRLTKYHAFNSSMQPKSMQADKLRVEHTRFQRTATEKQQLQGRTVRKFFGQDAYEGEVTEVKPPEEGDKRWLFHITYSDGDEEDMTEKELDKYLVRAASEYQHDTTPRPTGDRRYQIADTQQNDIILLRGNNSGKYQMARVVQVIHETSEIQVHFYMHQLTKTGNESRKVYDDRLPLDKRRFLPAYEYYTKSTNTVNKYGTKNPRSTKDEPITDTIRIGDGDSQFSIVLRHVSLTKDNYMAKEDLAKLSDTAQDAMSMSSAAAMEAGCT